MIGKIFYQTRWCLCRYENGILDILRNTCSAPLCFLQSKIPYNIGSVIASFEDGSIYFFDIRTRPFFLILMSMLQIAFMRQIILRRIESNLMPLKA